MKRIWLLIKRTFAEAYEDNVPRLAASLAFYSMFSIAPILVIVIAIASAFFGADATSREVGRQLQSLMGKSAADAVEALVRGASVSGQGTLATLISIVLLAYGSLSVFAELQDSLNTIWEVKLRPDISWWQTIRRRLLSFAMVLAICFLLLVSLVISAAIAAVSHWLAPAEGRLWQAGNVLASLVLFALLFAAIYKVLPDVKITWGDVAVGAIVTAILFVLGKFLIGLYLARPAVTSTYGAAGSLAILLIWVYYSSHILFLGAEFTQVYAKRFGKKLEPAALAVRITEEERAQEGIPHERRVQEKAEEQGKWRK